MDIFKHNNLGEVAAALAHNYRAELTTNTINEVDNDYYAFADDFKELQDRAFNIIAEREKAYKERTGQKVQAKTAKAVEIVLEINEDTTAQDIMDSYGEYFKSEFGAEILGIAVHKDEGYIVSKEPPHRPLTSGVEFELDQESGKYYHLKSNGATYERGAELDISKYSFIDNLHAQLIISNLREDGSSITGTSKLYPHFKKMDKEWMKYFANEWREIYNERLPHKQPLTGKDKNSDEPINSVYEPTLQLMADKIIQGTRNKQKLSGSLAQYIQDTQNPIKRIKGYKHFLSRLNKLAYTDEALNKRDYATFLSQMRESGANVRLQQILLQKLTQMSEEELKEGDSSAFGKFYGFFKNLLNPKELENTKEELKQTKEELENTKKENTELKAEIDTAKTELKKQINEGLEDNSQKHTALKEVFLSSDELDIYAKNKKIVAQAKDALAIYKTSEMISALKALKKQNRELEEILKKRALGDYAVLKARSGSKIAEEPKATQTLTQTPNRSQIAFNSPSVSSQPKKQR